MKKIITLLFLLILTGCQDQVFSKDLFYMNTYINIKIYHHDQELVNKTFSDIEQIYREYDQLCDRYKKHEYNLYYLNNELEKNQEVEIDKRLYDLLKVSKDYYLKTNKFFSIALGNVTDVWTNSKELPSYEELKASGSTDLDDIMLKENYIFSKNSDVSLDLGGIAKGYVNNKIKEYLHDKGIKKYLITSGTSSILIGEHYQNEKYRVGLINPLESEKIYKVLKLNTNSISTSGTIDNYYEFSGEKYSHIINPFTLYPDNYSLSVTVIASDPILTEVLSTTLVLLPIEEGKKLAEKYDVEVIWFTKDGIINTEGIKNYE